MNKIEVHKLECRCGRCDWMVKDSMKFRGVRPKKELSKLTPSSVRKRLQTIEIKIAVLQQEAKAIKKRCSHEGEIDLESDPSGGNDSFYWCRTCRAEWRSWPKDVPYNIGRKT